MFPHPWAWLLVKQFSGNSYPVLKSFVFPGISKIVVKKPRKTPVSATPMPQNTHGDPILGIIKFDNPWGYHKIWGIEKLKLYVFF